MLDVASSGTRTEYSQNVDAVPTVRGGRGEGGGTEGLQAFNAARQAPARHTHTVGRSSEKRAGGINSLNKNKSACVRTVHSHGENDSGPRIRQCRV